MKRLLLNSIVAGAALLASVSASAQTEKFYLGVTGYSTTDPSTGDEITVDATVYDDYSFVVGLPKKGQSLSANNATIDISMTNVASLGVSGTRSISKTLSTGLTSVTVNLEDYLTNCYAFGGLTCPVTVKDGNDNQSFIYTIGATTEQTDGTYTITGTPSSTADARAAWYMITDNVTAGTSSTDDSYLTIPAGTYIQIGNEKLTFDTGYSYLQGEWTLEGQMQAVKDNASLTTLSDVTGAESAKIIIYLPEGTTLALGSSYATLDKDATITIDASDAATAAGMTDDQVYSGYLSNLKEAANDADLPVYKTLYTAVKVFDGLVGLFGTAGTVASVPITVQFGEEVESDVKFYFGVTGYTEDDMTSATAKPVTVDATVYGDYSFVVGMSTNGDTLSSNNATIYSYMQNVASLGVDYRSYKGTLTTGVEGTVDLVNNWLSNAYSFKGATCPVTVIDGDSTQSFNYYISAATLQTDSAFYTITGTPSSTADASTAWHMITRNVSSFTRNKNEDGADINDDGNYVGFLNLKEGSFIQLGDQRLLFTGDYHLLSDADDDSGTSYTDELKAATTLKTYNVIGSDTYRFVMYFPAGSSIAMDESVAELNKSVALIVDATSYEEGEAIKSWIYNVAYQTGGIVNLISYFNTLIGLVDDAEEVPITLIFNPVLVDMFKTAGNAVLGMEVGDFKTLRDIDTNDNPDPNAVAELVCGDVPTGDDAINLVYEVETETDGVTTTSDVCNNLIITDKYPVNIPEEVGGFTATAASYSRVNTNFTNKNGLQAGTICLPFPVTSGNGVQFYEFKKLNTAQDLMYFEEAESIDANKPAAYSVASGSDVIPTVNVTASDVVVPTTEAKDVTISDYSMTFTGVQTDTCTLAGSEEYGRYYYIAQNKFWEPINNDVTVYPQRAYFAIDSTSGTNTSKSFNIVLGSEESTTTGITAVQNADTTVLGIYNTSGTRQSGLQKGFNIIRYADGQTRKVIVK